MTNVLNQTINDGGLRDIKPPIDLWNGPAWLWWLLGLLIVLAIAAFLFWKFRKKSAVTITVPVIPPHVVAKQRLEQALTLIAEPKPFCVAVSDTVRWYLEERFTFRAPERTTEEFLHELQNTDLLLPDQKASLADFLSACDLVKFARYEPGEMELRELHSSAMRLIEETEPAQSPIVNHESPNRKS
jgi:hypothetical protein